MPFHCLAHNTQQLHTEKVKLPATSGNRPRELPSRKSNTKGCPNMSQHKIATSPYTVIVGWDNPLQTYFAQVIDPSKSEEEELVCLIGASDELTTVDSLIV